MCVCVCDCNVYHFETHKIKKLKDLLKIKLKTP